MTVSQALRLYDQLAYTYLLGGVGCLPLDYLIPVMIHFRQV